MSKIIGIDLGTTNSVVAVMEGDKVTVIPNEEGGPDDTFSCGFHAKGRDPGWSGCQAAKSY